MKETIFQKLKSLLIKENMRIIVLILGTVTILFSFFGNLISLKDNTDINISQSIIRSLYNSMAILLGNYNFENSNALLYIASFFAIITVGYAVIILVYRKLRLFLFLNFSGFISNKKFKNLKINEHIIIFGAGDIGASLTLDIFEKHKDEKVVLVDIDEKAKNLSDLYDKNIYVYIKASIDNNALNNLNIFEAKNIVLTTGNDLENLKLLNLIKKYFENSIKDQTTEKEKTTSQPNIFIHLQYRQNYDLLEGFKLYIDSDDGKQEQKLKINSFSAYDNAAQILFQDYPIGNNVDTTKDDKEVHFGIVGFDVLGIALAYRALNLGHFYNGKPLNLYIFDKDSKKKKDEFLKIFNIELEGNEIQNWKISFHDEKELFNENILKQLNQVVFCDLSAQTNLTNISIIIKNNRDILADSNKQLFLYTDVGYELDCLPDIVNKDEKQNISIATFGDFGKICSYDNIIGGSLDIMAKKTHENYNELHGYNTPWEDLSLFLKDSNRMQIEHLIVKIQAMNTIIENNKNNDQAYIKEIKAQAQDKWYRYGDRKMLWGDNESAR